MTNGNSERGGRSGTPPTCEKSLLSRRTFCAATLSMAALPGLASAFERESPLIDRPSPPILWEYAYVYAYQ